MISIANLTKRYGDVTALSNIHLEIQERDVVGLLGPNGAGKTSLMRIITGSMIADTGTCIIGGVDMSVNPLDAQSFIGYLPEHPPLYLEMRVVDYLLFVAKIKGVRDNLFNERLNYALESTSLQDKKKSIIKTLSKGYRQRVGIAMSLMNNPKLLILDEPTAGLDPNQILEIRKLIRELAHDRTMIISSHILPEIASSCSRIIIISKGQIVAEDTTDNLASLAHGMQGIRIISANIKNEEEKKADLIKTFVLDKIECPNNNTAILYKKKLNELVEQIPKYLVKKGIAFTEYGPYRQSLEDVFRKLTISDGLDKIDEAKKDRKSNV